MQSSSRSGPSGACSNVHFQSPPFGNMEYPHIFFSLIWDYFIFIFSWGIEDNNRFGFWVKKKKKKTRYLSIYYYNRVCVFVIGMYFYLFLIIENKEKKWENYIIFFLSVCIFELDSLIGLWWYYWNYVLILWFVNKLCALIDFTLIHVKLDTLWSWWSVSSSWNSKFIHFLE